MSGLCGKTRREMLWETGAGFTGLALTGVLSADGFFAQSAHADAKPTTSHQPPIASNPLAAKPPMLPGKAKSVIFLFMYGGPSQLDTFDYKPHLVGRDGQTITVRSFREGNQPKQLKLMSRSGSSSPTDNAANTCRTCTRMSGSMWTIWRLSTRCIRTRPYTVRP